MRTPAHPLALLPACVLALLAGPVLADSHAYPLTNAAYRTECASCHVAYPPQLLPAESWQAIMDGLHRHFGSDASLDAQAAEEIRAYLAANAGRRASPLRAANSPPRITQTRWFVREHDEVPASLWKRDAVKSPANCGACHTRAEHGDYSERTLRLPR